MSNTCENCAESMGVVDDKFVWCKAECGIVAKSHSCKKFSEEVTDEPNIVDHWPVDSID